MSIAMSMHMSIHTSIHTSIHMPVHTSNTGSATPASIGCTQAVSRHGRIGEDSAPRHAQQQRPCRLDIGVADDTHFCNTYIDAPVHSKRQPSARAFQRRAVHAPSRAYMRAYMYANADIRRLCMDAC